MHTGTLRKCALALTFWLALHMSALKAQIFTAPLQASTTGTNPVDFEFRADGTMIAKGDYGVGSLLTADLGTGTRLLWFPSLSAFRAGGVNGTQWDTSNLGAYSVAFGFDTIASNNYSSASGYKTIASGPSSTAIGNATNGTGSNTLAQGVNSTASGYGAAAFDVSTTASGNYSLSAGFISLASGSASTALGDITSASGTNSLSAGVRTTASAYDSVAIGSANVGGGSLTTWVATDPLFEIGNGQLYGNGNPSAAGASDALVVYKNGSATFQGPVTVGAGGDIPMFTGN